MPSFVLFLSLIYALTGVSFQNKNEVFRVFKIWDNAKHNAFTDLIKYQGKYYCVFREGSGHVPYPDGTDGKIRILVSGDGEKWESVAMLEKSDYDLRDPKLSVDATGRLMVLMGGSNYNNSTGELIGRCTHVSFYNSKEKYFSNPVPVNIDPEIKSDYDWLWRVTWHKGTGYGVMYRKKDKTRSELFLLKTSDGLDYKLIKPLPVEGLPSEATVVFADNDDMIIVLRIDDGNYSGKIARSSYPYTAWTWKDLGVRLGGPDIIRFTDGWYIIGTRSYNVRNQPRTSIYLWKEGEEIKHILELPSGGDNSYPGLLIEGNELWVSYYSSHEGKTSVYLAKIPLSWFEANIKQ